MNCDISQVLPLLLSVLSCVASIGRSSSCPPDPLGKVQQCTDNVIPDLNKQSAVVGPDGHINQMEHASETCRDSRLRDVADCIQDILDRCRGTTEAEQTLQRLIDKEKTVNTVDYFCRHIRVYKEYGECIAQNHEETSNCSKDAHKNFKAKVSAGANIDVLIMGTCRFHAVARGCLTNTTQLRCGSVASNFVYTLLTGLMPPFCETMNPEYSHAQTTRGFHTERSKNSESNGADMNSLSIIVIGLAFIIMLKSLLI